MKYREYLHNIDQLRAYLASDFSQYVQYHLEHDEGFRIGPPQQRICEFLGKPGARERLIIGFRGLSKTYLVRYYCGWRHLRVPTSKIKIVSDNLSNAQKMAKSYLSFIKQSPVMNCFAPSSTRISRTRFDLDLIIPEKDPSLDSIGLEGSVTSTRADLIICDDVENIDNSTSIPLRENLLWRLAEMQAILHPCGRFLRGKDGFVLPAEQRNKIVSRLPESTEILYIGTYQHTKSIYLPTEDPEHPLYKAERLVIPALDRADEDPKALPVDGLEGKYVSAWPERFSTRELLERRKDGAKFFLDYLCDTKSLEKKQQIIDFNRLKVSDELAPTWNYCTVDPAMGGNCETAAAFGGPIDSRLYISDIVAWRGEPTSWIPQLVKTCKEKKVIEIHCEAKPEAIVGFISQEVMRQGGGIMVRTITPKGDKALRIAGNLEYPINSGQVVFHSRVINNVETRDQLEKLTFEGYDKHATVDRVDALSHLVSLFAHRLGVSPKVQSARIA